MGNYPLPDWLGGYSQAIRLLPVGGGKQLDSGSINIIYNNFLVDLGSQLNIFLINTISDRKEKEVYGQPCGLQGERSVSLVHRVMGTTYPTGASES